MATVTDNKLLRAALEYAGMGLHVVALHNILPGGNCSCRLGAQCPEKTRGKHPRIGEGWQNKTTTDEEKIHNWWSQWPEANIGVKLGPDSGIIDIEFDDEDGRRLAESLLGECFTPTYVSGRSTHRLFKWSEEFAGLHNVEVRGGLEFRLGSEAKGSQSVFPPSRHYSGRSYEWLAGLSLGDVDPIDVPDKALALLWNQGPGETANGRVAKTPEEWGEIIKGSTEGERNKNLTSYIGQLLRNAANLDDRTGLQVLFESALAVNERNDPPLEEQEVRSAFASILKREQQRRITESVESVLTPPVEQKIEPKQTGSWRLVIVESDPKRYELHAPQFCAADGGCIVLNKGQMCNVSAIRAEALEQAHYALPAGFSKVWNGEDGLFRRLVENAETRRAPLEDRRDLVVAQRLAERLGKARDYREDQNLATGLPQKLEDGSVVFAFNKVWEDMEFTADKIKRLELSRLLTKLGATWYGLSGEHRGIKLKKLSIGGLGKLEKMVSPDEKNAEQTDPI